MPTTRHGSEPKRTSNPFMKTKILEVLAVAILANVLSAQSSDNATPSPLMWQAAVKPDVPTSSGQQAVIFAESVSKGPSLPLFYSAQRNVPPLPFNPYPALPLFDIGDNKFVYDDRAVDYFSLFAGSALASESGGMSAMSMAPPCDPCSTNGSGGGGPVNFGGPAYSYSSTQLWVKITSTNSTNFLLDVNNTVSNVTYGVLAKSTVDTDPFNTWTLVNVFQATSTNKQISGAASAATRFYAAVNLNSYVGPTVSIVSPASGATVSNDMTLQVRVTDILPLTAIKVYVDGTQVRVIGSNQNGIVTVPTTWFPNGQHQIWVSVANEGVPIDTDGDSVVDEVSTFQGGASVNLNFTNEVRLQNYSPLYTKAGSITLQYSVTSTQNYTFEVFGTNGTLLHTTNGQIANGTLSRSWNYTDLTNNAVNDRAYVFSLTYSNAAGGAAAAAKKILTTNFVDQGVTVGKYVVSYGEYASSSLNQGMSDMNAYISVLINASAYFNEDIIGSGREDYNPPYVDFSSDPFKIRKAMQTNDVLALTNALKDVVTGSWLFQGHSTPVNLIHGKDEYLTVDLTSKQVAALLGNSYGAGAGGFNLSYGRRLFSTMLTGCSAGSAASEYPDATGTPPGVDQVSNSQIKKSAFIGFTQLSTPGTTKWNWINKIHFEWLDGGDYDTPISVALWRANLAYPAVEEWGPQMYGYDFLEYNGNESR